MSRFAIISLAFALVACAHVRVTDEVLSRYPAGTPVERIERELGLRRYPYEPIPNLPVEREEGRYHLPEGDIFVAWRLVDGHAILDSQPFILERK